MASHLAMRMRSLATRTIWINNIHITSAITELISVQADDGHEPVASKNIAQCVYCCMRLRCSCKGCMFRAIRAVADFVSGAAKNMVCKMQAMRWRPTRNGRHVWHTHQAATTNQCPGAVAAHEQPCNCGRSDHCCRSAVRCGV